MKKIFKYFNFTLLLILCITSITSPALGAVADYMPKAEDVEGYNLLYNSEINIEDVWSETEEDITVGAQVWYKNDTENSVSAVIGCLVVENENSQWDKNIPTLSLVAIRSIYTDFDGKTYWDLIVYVLTSASEEITDITTTVKTTDSSIEFNFGIGGYFIFSKDGDYFIITIAFAISNNWISFVQDTLGISGVFNATMTLMAGFLIAFSAFAPPSSAIANLPVSSAEPTGTDTDKSDVIAVTTSVGDVYGGGIPGFATPLVILSMIGGFALVYKKKIKK